jgi:hypothetical protein
MAERNGANSKELPTLGYLMVRYGSRKFIGRKRTVLESESSNSSCLFWTKL